MSTYSSRDQSWRERSQRHEKNGRHDRDAYRGRYQEARDAGTMETDDNFHNGPYNSLYYSHPDNPSNYSPNRAPNYSPNYGSNNVPDYVPNYAHDRSTNAQDYDDQLFERDPRMHNRPAYRDRHERQREQWPRNEDRENYSSIADYSAPEAYLNDSSRDHSQRGNRRLDPQGWQEREGAQRGAFGLQNSQRGKGPLGYTRSDERIKEDICEQLSEHHYIDASQVRVEVTQGVVTLEGAIDDRWQKYQTEDLVDGVSGVKDIQNRLSVSRPSQSTQRASPARQSDTQQATATSSTSAGAADSH